MKLSKIFISAGVVATMTLGACTGDLDLTPTDPNNITPGTFPEDPSQYMEQVMAGVYLEFATYGPNGSNILGSMDGGMSTFQRALFNLEEIPTDEANWLPSADAIDPNVQYGVITPQTTCVAGTYARLMSNVALCNNFLQTDFGATTDAEKAKFDELSRQAHILRGACYFYLIDLFGNVPWAGPDATVGSIPAQLSNSFAEGRRMVFDNAVAELEDVVAWYKANDANNKPAYGYVGLDAAEALLVKYYLNAEVYTGTAQWDKCYNHAQAIIGRLGKGGHEGSGLTYAYHQNFGYNNKQFAIGGASDINEIIWTIPQESATLNNGQGLLSYANGGFMCNAWIGDAPGDATFFCKQSDYNSGNGWKCMSARRQFVEIFDWDADYAYSPDLRTQFWKTAADGFNINNDVLDQANWGSNGFLAVKYTNWNIDDGGNIAAGDQPAPVDPLGVDYAMIRLAEVYLSAAEAALNGGGSTSEALKYVNYLRTRAGLDSYTNLNLVELQNERARELYTECVRRTDLIRYGKWISGYNWNWKNKVATGADYPANFNVYPLPTTVVTRNGYVQNPGY